MWGRRPGAWGAAPRLAPAPSEPRTQDKASCAPVEGPGPGRAGGGAGQGSLESAGGAARVAGLGLVNTHTWFVSCLVESHSP